MKRRVAYLRIFILAIATLALPIQKIAAAPFKEPSSSNRAAVLCVLPQPTDDSPKDAMASSTVAVPRQGQQTKSGQQQNALDNGHSLPHADGSPSTRHGPSSEAKAEEKGKISGLEMKSAGQTVEKSNQLSGRSTKNSYSPSSDVAAKTLTSPYTKEAAKSDGQSVSVQLLAADAADAAKFNGIPQKSGGKGSASKIKVNSNVNGVSSPTSVTSQMPKESQGKVSPIIRSNYVVPGAVLVPSGNGTIRQANLFGEKFDASAWLEQTQRNDQGNVWTEMDHLRGRESMSAGEIQDTLHKAIPGKDYPNYSSIPTTSFRCEDVHQAGFYADPEARLLSTQVVTDFTKDNCQVIRRCDINAMKWSYLCPNGTLFSQITLTCEWFFNIDCNKAVQYYDYSNSRLYHSDWVLLDTPPDKAS